MQPKEDNKLDAAAIVLAIIAVLFIAVQISDWAASRGLFEYHYPKDKQDNTADRYCNPTFRIIEPAPTGQSSQAGEGEKPSDIYNSCQQWRSAQAAIESAYYARLQYYIVGVGGLILVFFGALAAWLAAKWAQHAAISTEKAWIAAERPWLSIICSKITSVHIDENTVKARFNIRIKNVGNAPATNINIRSVMFDNVSVAKERVAQFVPGTDPKSADIGFYLFPGAFVTSTEYVFFNRQQVTVSRPRAIMPNVTVIVEYKSPNHKSWHLTTEIRMIFRATDKTRPTQALRWGAGDIPVEDVDFPPLHVGSRAT